MIHTCSFTL